MTSMRHYYPAEQYGNASIDYSYYPNELSIGHDEIPMFPAHQPRNSIEPRHPSINFGTYDYGYHQPGRLQHHGFHPIDPEDDQYSQGSYSTGSPTSTNDSRHSPHLKTKRIVSSEPVSSSEQRHLPSNNVGKPYCTHRDCSDEAGNPVRFFSRKADVGRHHRSQHEQCYLDCPVRKCVRKGTYGFTRNDHLIEHRRQYHGQTIAKRQIGSGGSRHSPS